MLIDRNESALIVVDIQERLAPAMHDGGEEAIHNSGVLMQGAAWLGIPVLVSEQYPRGLLHTVPALKELMGNDIPAIEKTEFACPRNASFMEKFQATGRKQAIVTGMEAHICVLQTAMQLIEQDVDVFVVADAVASRTRASMDHAFTRIDRAGGAIVTTEMVIFEWLEKAGTDDFKALQKLIA